MTTIQIKTIKIKPIIRIIFLKNSKKVKIFQNFLEGGPYRLDPLYMCHSQFKERRACTTSSCNVAPHIVGFVLCCTRCWYLYQVNRRRAARILLFGLVKVVEMVVVVVIVVGNARLFNQTHELPCQSRLVHIV